MYILENTPSSEGNEVGWCNLGEKYEKGENIKE
jgi:hypothetical protein